MVVLLIVRLLLDNHLSPAFTPALRELRGINRVLHIGADLGRPLASDDEIRARAVAEGELIITSDRGFRGMNYPICTHPGIVRISAHVIARGVVIARLRALWRSGFRYRLAHAIAAVDVDHVRIEQPGNAFELRWRQRQYTAVVHSRSGG